MKYNFGSLALIPLVRNIGNAAVKVDTLLPKNLGPIDYFSKGA
jgi:hypothetical protein